MVRHWSEVRPTFPYHDSPLSPNLDGLSLTMTVPLGVFVTYLSLILTNHDGPKMTHVRHWKCLFLIKFLRFRTSVSDLRTRGHEATMYRQLSAVKYSVASWPIRFLLWRNILWICINSIKCFNQASDLSIVSRMHWKFGKSHMEEWVLCFVFTFIYHGGNRCIRENTGLTFINNIQ